MTDNLVEFTVQSIADGTYRIYYHTTEGLVYVDWPMLCEVVGDPLVTARELKQLGMEYQLRDIEGGLGRHNTIVLPSLRAASLMGYWLYDSINQSKCVDVGMRTWERWRRRGVFDGTTGKPLATVEVMDGEQEIVEIIQDLDHLRLEELMRKKKAYDYFAKP